MNTGAGSVSIRASEYSTSADRPYLTVTYSSTQFGIHPLPPNDYTNLAGQLDRVEADKINLVRFLFETASGVSSGDIDDMAMNAKGNGQKVFIHIPVGSRQESEHVASPTDFKDLVMSILDFADDNPNGNFISDGTIVAVEIGGEEENKVSKWRPGFTPTEMYYYGDAIMGANFAEYYLEAAKAIRQTYPGLEIISGGAVEKHDSLDYETDSSWGNAGNFLRGFIAKTIESATIDGVGKYDYLPDTISIHNYRGQYSPENLEDLSGTNGVIAKEWFERLETLRVICDEKGVIPNFAATEYGYSLIPGATQAAEAPTSITETGQAIYYLRDTLINATTRPQNGIGWKTISRFSHNKGVVNGIQDFGFHKDDSGDSGFGTKRAIKFIAQGLFDPTNPPVNKRIMLKDPNTSVWLPVSHQDPPDESTPGIVWCGWETPNAKWGAIWRYKRTPEYGTIANNTEIFEVPGAFSSLNVAARYRFTITPSSGTTNASVSLDEITTGTVTKPTSTTFSIPDVNHNPILIRFQ